MLDRMIQKWLVAQRSELAEALSVCESPPEQMMAVALLCAEDERGPVFLWAPNSKNGVIGVRTINGDALRLQKRLWLKNGEHIRIDIAIGHPGSATVTTALAIEIDGFMYHDRNPADAQRDKARDRELTERGWNPVRFTAGEVMHDPEGSAASVLRLLGLKPKEPGPMMSHRLPVRNLDLVRAVRDAATPGLEDEILGQVRDRARARSGARS